MRAIQSTKLMPLCEKWSISFNGKHFNFLHSSTKRLYKPLKYPPVSNGFITTAGCNLCEFEAVLNEPQAACQQLDHISTSLLHVS